MFQFTHHNQILIHGKQTKDIQLCHRVKEKNSTSTQRKAKNLNQPRQYLAERIDSCAGSDRRSKRRMMITPNSFSRRGQDRPHVLTTLLELLQFYPSHETSNHIKIFFFLISHNSFSARHDNFNHQVFPMTPSKSLLYPKA